MASIRLSRTVVTIVLLLAVASVATAQHAILYGRILDGESRQPLEGASVFLRDARLGCTSDPDGWYTLYNVPPGKYRIAVCYLGYEEKDLTLTFTEGDTLHRNILMIPSVVSGGAVTVTATRGNSLITDIPSSVDVVDARVIERENPQNLAEVMDGVQGVFIKDYGGIGGIKTVSLRGSSSEQVLVLMDGQRLNNPQNGQVDFSTISVEGIERIEVVRGGNSAIYGADAVGGVINIITKKGVGKTGIEANVSGAIGSFQTRTGEGSFQYNLPRSLVNVSYRYLTSKGDFEYTDEGKTLTKQNNDVMAHEVFARQRMEFGNPHNPSNLNTTYIYHYSERGSPGTSELPYYSARTSALTHQLTGTLSMPLARKVDHLKIQANAQFGRSTYDNTELLVPTHSRNDTRTAGGEAQINTVLSTLLSLTYGAGGRYEEMEGNSFQIQPSRTTTYAFLQSESSFHPALPQVASISLIPAVRLDRFSDFGVHISPKVGSVLNMDEYWLNTSLKGNVGLSFRAPTFNDMYWPADAYTEGNPDLQPEHGWDYDVGVRFRLPTLNHISVDLTWFENRMSDLIVWQSDPNAIWRPHNLAKTRLKGTETSLSLEPIRNHLSLNVNYTFLLSENKSGDSNDGNVLPYRPKNVFNLGATCSWQKLDVSYQFTYTGLRYVNAANAGYLNAYTTSSVTAAWTPTINGVKSNFTFQVNNLLDERYEVIQYQPMPGREYRFTLGMGLASGKKRDTGPTH